MKSIIILLLSLLISGIGNAQKTINYEKETYIIGVSAKQDEVSLISKDLSMLNVKYTYLTTIKEEDIPKIHNTLGPNYDRHICLPVISSYARELIGKLSIEEIYSSKRDLVADELFEESAKALQEYNIILKGIYITLIDLHPSVKEAINRKQVVEQNLIAKKHEIEISKKEAEIKLIKAESDAKQNKILDSSLTEKLIKIKYIDALLEIAKSQNSKVIILGDDKIDLPAIINEKTNQKNNKNLNEN